MNFFAKQQDELNHFSDVLTRVDYPGFYFVVSVSKAGAFFFQIECVDTCNTTGRETTWRSRKWLLSAYMTDGEIVQTAFKAVMTALEHEAREKFTYRGVSVYDPHYDIEKLVELRQQPDSIKGRE